MVINNKFYVISIVSIFIALTVGIFIGFSIDTTQIYTDQEENLVNIVEEQFQSITEENIQLNNSLNRLQAVNQINNNYIRESLNYINSNKVNGKNIGIIETNNQYTTVGLGSMLENYGANVNFITLIKDYENIDLESLLNEIIVNKNIENLKQAQIDGKFTLLGDIYNPIDVILISGGAFKEDYNNYGKIDKRIIEYAKNNNIDIIGIEKSNVRYSYISNYIDSSITTIDNIDMKIGETALILSIDGNMGNYGVKSTADSIIPRYKGEQ